MKALIFLQYSWVCFQLPDREVVLRLEINKLDNEVPDLIQFMHANNVYLFIPNVFKLIRLLL